MIQKSRTPFMLFAVAAMAFIFSCSSGDGSDDNAPIQAASSSSEISSSSSLVLSSSSSSSSGCVHGVAGLVPYEGKSYKTICIGGQNWFAENLNYEVEGSKCYDNLESNCETYGRLYDWSRAMGFLPSCNSTSCSNQIQSPHKGICPYGWHIPSRAEWYTLITYVSDIYTAGTKLKATTGWYTGTGYIPGTDNYGFSALPGGYGNYSGPIIPFHGVGERGRWWTTSQSGVHLAYSSYMDYNDEHMNSQAGIDKRSLYSVRCLQDSSSVPNSSSSVPSSDIPSSSSSVPSSSSEIPSSSSLVSSSSSSITSSSSSVLSSSSLVPSSSSFTSSSSSLISSSSSSLSSSSVLSSSSFTQSSSSFVPLVSCTNPVVSDGSVTCGGQTYKTVVIGTQTWMAENLNYNPGTGNSACYDNLTNNCTAYGRLYDWSTAMNLPSSCNSTICSDQVQLPHRGICPAGWHLPSNAEWATLTDQVGGSSKLKATTGWVGNGNGTDEYGFSALPGGYGNSDGDFSSGGGEGYWWSSTGLDSDKARGQRMDYNYSSVSGNPYGRILLFSVRCLKD